jgi:hypothetical protein
MRYLLAIVLSFYVGFAYSQPPIPTPNKGVQQPPAQTKDSEQHAAQQHGNRESPVIVETTTGSKTKEASQKEERERKEKSPDDWWIAGSTIALAIFTAALAVFTACLWGSTSKLVERTQDTAKKQLRAYVTVDSIEIEDWRETNNPTANLIVKNTGVTIAKDVVIHGYMRILPFPMPGKLPFQSAEELWSVPKSRWILGPNGGTRDKQQSIERPEGGLTSDEISALKNNTKAIYVYGIISYVDIYDITRTTEYKFFSNGKVVDLKPQRIAAYQDGNEAT